MRKILPLFSYIFHPLFISFYASVLYLTFYGIAFENQEKLLLLLQIVLITIVIPILIYFLLRTFGKINSIVNVEISERKIPLVFQCFLIILLVKTSVTIDRYPELHFFFLGALLSTLLALLLLFVNTKASIHMLSISALTLFTIGLSTHLKIQMGFFIPFLVLMNGFVGSSRLEMKAHTNKELIIGFLLGSIPQLLLQFLWL